MGRAGLTRTPPSSAGPSAPAEPRLATRAPLRLHRAEPSLGLQLTGQPSSRGPIGVEGQSRGRIPSHQALHPLLPISPGHATDL